MSRWKLPLSSSQKRGLDEAILEYVEWNFENTNKEEENIRNETISSLRKLFDIGDDQNQTKNDGILLLPKKWNSIVQLQRKIMILEEKLKDVTAMKGEEQNEPTEYITDDWVPSSKVTDSIMVDASVTAVKLHPYLTMSFAATENGKLYAYDLMNTSIPVSSIQAHNKGITSIDVLITTDQDIEQTIIATSSKDLQIKLFKWNSSTGKFNLVRSFLGHDDIVSHVKLFNVKEPCIASCSRDGTIKIWNTKNGFCLKSISAHHEWVRTIDVLDEYILSGSHDSSLRLTHWKSGNGLSIGVGHTFPVETCKIKPLNKHEDLQGLDEDQRKLYETMGFRYVISGGRDSQIKIWEVPLPKFPPHRPPIPHINQELNKFACIHNISGHSSWVREIKLNYSGNLLFSCSDDKSIRCWNTKTGEVVKVWENLHRGFINCIDLDSNDNMNKKTLNRHILVTGGLDNKINILMK